MSGKPGRNGGRGRGGGKYAKLVESLRDACPPYKQKDLEALVKELDGDEEQIRQKIADWWEEPSNTHEEEWEDVNKRTNKKKEVVKSRGPAGRGGRGRSERGRGGPDKTTAGRGRGTGRGGPHKESNNTEEATAKPETDEPAGTPAAGLPKTRNPQGVWAKASEKEATVTAPVPTQEPAAPAAPVAAPVPVAPPVPVAAPVPSVPKASRAVPSGGNVWATKGSAHLIRAEKPLPTRAPPASPAKPQAPEPPKPVAVEPAAAISSIKAATPSLEGARAWAQGPSNEPALAPVAQSVPREPVPQEPLAPPRASQPRQAPALNLGHWDTGDADESKLDFGFGSFGTDNDATKEVATPQTGPAQAPSATGPSPARPPPGLSIGGMPPMPTNAVLVHELENKLEEATLNNKAEEKPVLPQHTPNPIPPQPGYGNQYGMGMYNYNAAATGTAFVGMPGAAPVLGGVPPPQKPNQQVFGGVNSAPTPANGATDSTPASGMPPGMHGMPPYANPAMYYGQQPYHMGQPQGGMGYNYGYGQFGGAVQGGFGYPQGPTGGYPPHYDEQGGHTGGTNYQKNSGGYRGRNHNNQYQNQYTPQQYGGQPYGMGYHGEHFNPRGGYGGMQDPYGGMPQQQQPGQGNYGGGFQQEDQFDGKKGRGFQQQGGSQIGSQPPFGGDSNQPTGWSNQGGWGGGTRGWQSK